MFDNCSGIQRVNDRDQFRNEIWFALLAPATYANRLRIQLLISRREGLGVWRGARRVYLNVGRESRRRATQFSREDKATCATFSVFQNYTKKRPGAFTIVVIQFSVFVDILSLLSDKALRFLIAQYVNFCDQIKYCDT